MWADYFKFFAESLEDKKITDRDEAQFEKVVSILALNHFKFTELMGDKLKDPEGILEVLTETVSLAQLKAMSEAQFSKLQVEWHTLFIEMNKCLGKLKTELPVNKKAPTQAMAKATK
jgi:hypothetical protein